MTSRKTATMLGLFLAGGTVLTTTGVTIGAVEADPREPDAVERTASHYLTVTTEDQSYVVGQHTETYPLRGGQAFDRGVWCAFKKVPVYDRFHDETYFIDKKVCLGTISR